jgi:predicted nucleic acid-binding protein
VGLTLDTGALIALERRELRMAKVLAAATAFGRRVTVPTAAVVEWWRGQRGMPARFLDGLEVEPLTERVARSAGEALAAVKGPGPIDAIVMASAAQRGDVVYTADFGDLEVLRRVFPAVRVLAV